MLLGEEEGDGGLLFVEEVVLVAEERFRESA